MTQRVQTSSGLTGTIVGHGQDPEWPQVAAGEVVVALDTTSFEPHELSPIQIDIVQSPERSIMNYSFVLRSESGSGYKIDCRFGRQAAIGFAEELLGNVGNQLNGPVSASFDEHEADGHGMFSVGSVGSFALVAVKE